MLDFTKPLQTRDGRPLRIFDRDGGGTRCILGAVQKNIELTNQGMTLMLGGSGIYGLSRGLTKLGSGIGSSGSSGGTQVTGGDGMRVSVSTPTDANAAASEIAKIP